MSVLKNPFYREVRGRLKKRMNTFIIVVGPPGSGKSYTSLAIASRLAPNRFKADTIKDFVAFNIEDFFRIITTGKLNNGDVVIFEETGCGAGARSWQSKENILFSKHLQSYRGVKRLIIIFTVPHISFVDSHIRRLANYQINADGITTDHETGATRNKCQIKTIRWGEDSDKHGAFKVYRPFIYTSGIKWRYYEINKAPEDIIDAYETLSLEEKKKITEESQKLFCKEEEKNKFDEDNALKELREELEKYAIEENLGRLVKNRRGRWYVDKDLIQARYKVGDSIARRMKAGLEEYCDNQGLFEEYGRVSFQKD